MATEVDVLHSIEACGGVAFVYDHVPQFGEVMDASHVVRPAAKNGWRILCMTCHLPVSFHYMQIGEVRDAH